MYTVRQLLTGIRNPYLGFAEINRLFSEYVMRYLRPPQNVFDEDWDNLIILDGCRYDILTEFEFDDAKFEWRWSGGSHSKEFLKYNVEGKQLDDVVWVTANPRVSRYADDIFEIRHVWDTGWNDEYQTVLPETIEAEAKTAADEFPHKRLVVHFMQPHFPFIGSIGRSELPDHRSFTGGGMMGDSEEDGTRIWDHLKEGTVERETVWRAYRENLELALPAARRLVDDLTGKSIITSDHGNEFGGRCFPIPIRLYGHNPRYRTKNLVKVPWVVFESSDRRSIEAGEGISETVEVTADVDERLKQMGYK